MHTYEEKTSVEVTKDELTPLQQELLPIMRRILKKPGTRDLTPFHLRLLAEMSRGPRMKILSDLRRGKTVSEVFHGR